jgi:glycosyltransferase involved in cell wall biosynthesis
MTTPTVSVVVSAFQAAAYLQRSLVSVLSQSFGDIELIVVDDGSTDTTPQILDALAATDSRVRVLRQENRGLTAALIRACAEARGEFIARHDTDDLSLPDRLTLQVARLRTDPRLSFVSCWSHVVGPRDEPLYEIHGADTPAEATRCLLEGLGPPHGSVTFRTAAYRRVGGYRPAFRYAQDHDLWLRLADDGLFDVVPVFLYALRVHADSISARRRSQQARLADLARQCATTRRAAQPEQAWLDQAAVVSAEPPPALRRTDPGNTYFIGKCLLDRRDRRCLDYLRRAVRERPSSWRAWAALLLAQRLRLAGPQAPRNSV